jgi:hypothetical protein
MGSRSECGPAGDGGGKPGQVSEARDRLYAAPLDGFVALRRELAVALKAAGDPAASRTVAAMAKPSRTAWALNQVARKRPDLVKGALDGYASAQAAQKDGEGEAMRASARLYRDRVAEVIDAASGFVREDGSELGSAQGRRIGATLQAIASGGDAALREGLVRGRLVADVDVDDPFAGLEFPLDGPDRKADRATKQPAHRSRHSPSPGPSHGSAHRGVPDEVAAARVRAAERERVVRAQELEKRRARIAALEAEAKEARASAREAEVVAGRAQAEAERARRAVEALDRRLDEARRALRTFGA